VWVRGAIRVLRLVVRKNLMLTLWLIFPIAVFGGLVAWIFGSAGSPRKMEAVPVGPGAGDTGGANALGEWLSGRDPNAVERANIARREGQAVDPFWWPEGTRFVVRAEGPVEQVTVGWVDSGSGLLSTVALKWQDGVWVATARDRRPAPGSTVYVSASGIRQVISGGERRVTDDGGVLLVPRAVPPVLAAGTMSSEPIVVEFAWP
jgi:hypothetical protein